MKNPIVQVSLFADKAKLSYEGKPTSDNPHTVATIAYGEPWEVMRQIIIFLPLGGRIEEVDPHGETLRDLAEQRDAARAEAEAAKQEAAGLREAARAALAALGHVEDDDALKCVSILEQAIRAAGIEVEG